jgi:hypothetical protein
MKITRKALWIFASLSAFSAAVMSSQVSPLIAFTDGEVLTADELNNNNAAIMTAVNDNDTAITTAVNDINSKHKFYTIGDTGPAGGLVFHIENGGRNGLEAAPEDQDDGTGASWGCDVLEVSGADGVLIERGATNILDVMEHCLNADSDLVFASKLAYDYVSGGYTDWFLPSKDELNAMLTNLDFEASGSLNPILYWSSSENNASTAWSQNTNENSDGEPFAKDIVFPNGRPKVRAVRAF